MLSTTCSRTYLFCMTRANRRIEAQKMGRLIAEPAFFWLEASSIQVQPPQGLRGGEPPESQIAIFGLE